MPPPQDRTQGPNDIWTPEPELRDTPPRRVGPSEYPDLNKPNGALYLGVGGGLAAVGLVLFILGMAQGKALFYLSGIVLLLGGAALLVIYPTKARAHAERAQRLVEYGVPVIARILAADNMTGDAQFARMVKYQVTLPGGEMAHRTVNADERALPRRIPGDATALVDMQTGDAELYCALPLRAVPKGEPVTQTPRAQPVAPVTPVYAPPVAAAVPTPPPVPAPAPAAEPGGGMGTLNTPLPQRPARPAAGSAPAGPTTAESEPAPAPGEQKQGQSQQQGTTSGLPWE